MDKPKIDMNDPLIQCLKSEDELEDGKWKELSEFLTKAIGSENLDKICSDITEDLGEDIEKSSRSDRRGKLLSKLAEIADLVESTETV